MMLSVQPIAIEPPSSDGTSSTMKSFHSPFGLVPLNTDNIAFVFGGTGAGDGNGSGVAPDPLVGL